MDEPRLPLGAGIFLLIVGILVDGLQLLLNLIFIGIIINPLISGFTWLIFWMTLTHNDLPMMGGRRAASGWLVTIAELLPGADGFVPGWSVYALYIMFSGLLSDLVGSAVGSITGIMRR
ncbi:MAG: hypothetical protein NUV59_02815 [Patescibacteria group bacterium]|nr:hypothetical protein [Patescibacteria group bacterium]